uniref:EGF-like domain-containing protein n=2 Tax=Lutzomyia longipalpis TaxID=7200 RepID=A0A1B0GHG8_LUTLO
MKTCEEECTPTADCEFEECVKGCHCRSGFKRIDGACVAEAGCNPCGPDEVYKCGRDCEDQLCGLLDINLCLDLPCQNGCYCQDGFLRLLGICVRVDLGVSLCPCAAQGQEFGCKSDCSQSCEEIPSQCDETNCRWGCHCLDGFREQGGACVPEALCACGANETPRTGKTCEDDCSVTPAACTASSDPTGFKCFCNPGFCRGTDGTCVVRPDNIGLVNDTVNLRGTLRYSGIKCGSHEDFLTCGPSCEIDCLTIGTSCEPTDCQPGCFCRPGYVREYPGGKCISQKRCARPSCPKHEEFLFCGEAPLCQTTCENYGQACDIKRSANCPQGCYCKHGYARHPRSNQCVHVKNCPTIEYDCYNVLNTNNNNNNYLNNYPKNKTSNILNDNPKDKITSTTTKKTIPTTYSTFYPIKYPTTYPTTHTTKYTTKYPTTYPTSTTKEKTSTTPIIYPTETTTDTTTTQKVKTTTSKTKTTTTPSPTTTSTTDNPSEICSKHEEYVECGPPCEVECSNLGQNCPIPKVKCTSGCFCKPGYARDETSGLCIPQRNCPTPFCPKYEVWLPCGQAPDCQEMCSGVDISCNIRKHRGKCPSGCYCRKGYARHPTTGLCVKKRDCPVEPECSENETYQECGYRCGEVCEANSCQYEKCESGCFCSDGFVRIGGHCVPKENCAKKCPPNEEFSLCSKRCSEECNVPEKFCKKEPCVEGCFCINGYKRVGDVCVPVSNCPPPKCSKPNEVYTTCGKSCNEDCTKSWEDCTGEQCHEGCFCAKGYKRVRRRCIPEEECICPEKEEYKCGNDCDEDCNSSSTECWEQKCSNKCHCIGNYKRINGVCQPPANCQCPSNEEYTYSSKCSEECGKLRNDCTNAKKFFGCFCKANFKRINGICLPDTDCQCRQNEHYAYDCKDVDFYRSCFCQLGYKRINGVCLPEKDCLCGRNEVYSLGNDCWDNCKTKPEECKALAVYKRCNCKAGYKRIHGNCVPDSRCQCNQHEVYKYSSRCNEVCNNSTVDCTKDEYFKGCFREEGYVRRDGKCIKGTYCECGENEEYVNSNTCSEDCSKTWLDCRNVASSFTCTCIKNFKRINGNVFRM